MGNNGILSVDITKGANDTFYGFLHELVSVCFTVRASGAEDEANMNVCQKKKTEIIIRLFPLFFFYNPFSVQTKKLFIEVSPHLFSYCFRFLTKQSSKRLYLFVIFR